MFLSYKLQIGFERGITFTIRPIDAYKDDTVSHKIVLVKKRYLLLLRQHRVHLLQSLLRLHHVLQLLSLLWGKADVRHATDGSTHASHRSYATDCAHSAARLLLVLRVLNIQNHALNNMNLKKTTYMSYLNVYNRNVIEYRKCQS